MISNIQLFILRKLIKMRKWGKNHTAFENLMKSLPGHLKGDAKDAAEELIKKGFILPKLTNYGLQVSLNPKMKATIEKLMQT